MHRGLAPLQIICNGAGSHQCKAGNGD